MTTRRPAGVRDSLPAGCPASSVPCDELRETLCVAIEARRAAGQSPERILEQVHGKYEIVMAQ